MNPPLVLPSIGLRPILPLLVMAATAALVLLLDLVPPRERKDHLGFVSALGVVATLIVTYWMIFSAGGADLRGFHGMVVLDTFALFFNIIIGYATGLVLLLSMDYIRREGMESGEFYILLLLSAIGMMLMASAGDLIIVFLGLETMSIALYVLAGFFRTRIEAGEASMKYFLIGAFSSRFFLYGIALIFGATGTTNLDRIANAVTAGAGRDPLLIIGLGLLLVGFGFKISSVPFHMWAPDVYEGAPTSVTAFIATGSKAAAFAALLRVLLTAVRGAPIDSTMLLWVLAAVSMTLGNVVALAQQNLKRMLAYSGIAHAGYILLGVLPGTAQGFTATLFYIAAYSVMNFGAFAVVTAIGAGGEQTAELSYWRGLFYRRPFLATVMTIFMISLAGIPPTVGFFAKLFVFQALVTAQIWAPLVVAVIMTIVSFYYYLRVIVVMLTVPEEAVVEQHSVGFSTTTVLGAAALATIVLGIFPAVVLDWATHAASVHF